MKKMGCTMSKNILILVIVGVVLVGALGLTVGMLVGNQKNPTINITNNTTTATPTSQNNAHNNNTSAKKTTAAITSTQAGTIAMNYANSKDPRECWKISSVNFGQNGVYTVKLYNKDNQTEVQTLHVNSQSGKIV
jgi:hypothetical protein